MLLFDLCRDIGVIAVFYESIISIAVQYCTINEINSFEIVRHLFVIFLFSREGREWRADFVFRAKN